MRSFTDDQDLYDPRLRVWYLGADETDTPFWSEAYIFFTSQDPGVTIGAPVHTADANLIGVAGADISMRGITAFLASSNATESTTSYIIDERSRIIAFSAEDDFLITDGDEIRYPTLDEISDPVVSASWNAFNEPTVPNPTIVEVDGERFHTHFAPLPSAPVAWRIGVQIPESEYVGTFGDSLGSNTATFALIGLLATAAGLLIARSVINPMTRLRDDAHSLIDGNSVQWREPTTPIAEIHETAKAVIAASMELEERMNYQHESEMRAVAANKSKSEFLAAVSHELRTPLTAIIGFSSLLENSTTTSEAERAEHIGLIRTSADHLLQLINDILDIAKIESGEFEITEDVVTLTDELANVTRMLGPRARSKSIDIEQDVSSSIRLQCDQRRTRQIFINLLSNAVKFSHSKSTISIAALPSVSGDLIVTVTDKGIGMSTDEIEIALRPFGQVAEGVGNNEGTGLGLPLTAYLVESHGGTLTIKSKPDEGTSVSITYPTHRVLHW